MAETRRHPDIEPAHPGQLLAEVVIPASGRSKTEFARLVGLSRQTLYAILDGRQAVTPEVAVRLGKLCGNGPALWLRMQQARDVWRAERTVDVSAIPTLEMT